MLLFVCLFVLRYVYTVYPRLAMNLESSCLTLQVLGLIIGMCYYTYLKKKFTSAFPDMNKGQEAYLCPGTVKIWSHSLR